MYYVTLSACGNIDHDENPYTNVVNGVKVESDYAACESIEECQKAVCKYIDDNSCDKENGKRST